MSEEFIQISTFLSPEQIAFLDEVAKEKGVRGRQAPLRWAIDHYRLFYLSQRSTYQIDRHVEQSDPAPESVNA